MPDAKHLLSVWNPTYSEDLRQVVSGDLKGTVIEIHKLQNARDNDRPISIYGGIFDVPLIVRRDPPSAWFTDKEDLTGGRLWAQLEAELRGESNRVAREETLRSAE